jgi:hypothetical protein
LILELGTGQIVRALVDEAQISQLLNAALDLGVIPIYMACRDGPGEHSSVAILRCGAPILVCKSRCDGQYQKAALPDSRSHS